MNDSRHTPVRSSSSFVQSIHQLNILGGLVAELLLGPQRQSVDVQQVSGKDFLDRCVLTVEETTKCLQGGHSTSAGRRPDKLGYQQSTRQSTGGHYQAIGADRTQWSAIEVGDTCKRAEVPRRKSVDDFIMSVQRSWTRFPQGGAANGGRAARRRCGWIAAGELRSRVQHWLESSDQVDRKASKGTVVVVQTS